MFTHLLVPLDGSRLAEAALFPAAQLAARVNAAITIVHVIEKGAPAEIHSDRHLVSAEDATVYLAEVAAREFFSGLHVETHLHTAEVSDVARSIVEHSAELAPDLIVMTTHGRGSARRIVSGTIAQQVIASGRTPVLMVRPTVEEQTVEPDIRTGDWRVILAPLDGNASHEKGLPVAAELAIAFQSRVHLLMVVPKFGNLRGPDEATSLILPGATRAKLEMVKAGSLDYLEEQARLFANDGIETVTETMRGAAADAIVKVAHRVEADLVVLGTHGRSGVDAFWSGSVAAQVAARTHVPLLLVPLKE